ncbi:MAG: hypothetical protein WD512_17940 [Candidatus Paceibacterota bacterium]
MIIVAEILKVKKLTDKRITIFTGVGLGYLVFSVVISLFVPSTPLVTQVLIPLTIGVAVGVILSIISVKLNYQTALRQIEIQSSIDEINNRFSYLEIRIEELRQEKYFEKERISEKEINDIKKLIEFLQDLKFVLTTFVDRYEEYLPGENKLKNYFVDARPFFTLRFEQMINFLEKEKPITSLQREGLSGPELALKLAAINVTYQEVRYAQQEYEETKRTETDQNNSKSTEKGMHILDTIKHYLGLSNEVLDSLGKAGVPGSGGGKELKGITEKVIGWWRDQRKSK